ncbi:MAG: chaperone modulator CbpM [Roseiflexaceae bacterium]
MTTKGRQLNPREAAAATRMDVSIIWHYAELGLVTPSPEGYSDADLVELRRVRRLREDLELDHPAIEIILRMGRRIQALQAEIRRLESAMLAARGSRGQPDWVEAEWDDLF